MGRISEDTIQQVAAASDIVDVIGSYFPLKRAGTSFRAICPFHREKTPSFHVNPARQSFHCFGCGAGGAVFRFVMDYEHIDFPASVRKLAQRAGITIVEEEGFGNDEGHGAERARLLAIHAEAAAWFHDKLLKSSDAKGARDYINSRGMNRETATNWQLGYAPDTWDSMILLLRDRGFRSEEILKSGLASSRDEGADSGKMYDRFRGRLMFPIRNDFGEVIAFSGRVLDPDAKTAKYVNSPETPLFTKGRVLYGLDRTKRDLINENTAIVCEGQIDLISAYEAGIRNVIAPQGTAFTGDQARLLKRFVETVVLCFDADNAGREAVARSLPALFESGLSVRVVRLPRGEDPDSIIRKQGADAFRTAVAEARDFFDYSLESATGDGNFEAPEARAAFIRQIAPHLTNVRDGVLRESLIGKLSSRLGISAASIVDAMSRQKPTPETPQSSAASEPQETLELSPGLAMLCHVALTSEDARTWLGEKSVPPPAQLDPQGALLEKILQASLTPGDPASTASFFSTLPASEERALAQLSLQKAPADPLRIAMTAWQGMAAACLQEEVKGLISRLRQPGLPSEERTVIQKQILDLQVRLTDVSRPLPEAQPASA